jgi:hypothetical protein
MRNLILGIASIFISTCICHSALANERFTVSSNGNEVTDTTTGLIWRSCSEGQIWEANRCLGKAKEFNYKESMAHAQSRASKQIAWRIPTIEELTTLVNKGSKPAILDAQIFPDTVANRYWSSTPHETEATQAMIVHFKDGHIFKYHRNNKAHVRLVRD